MQRTLPAVVLFAALPMLIGCGAKEPVDPWAETELSRKARELPPISVGDDMPMGTLKGIVSTALAIDEVNLYDLHHPDGAMATFSQRDIVRAVMTATAVGMPVEFDQTTGVATVAGIPRQLWLSIDRTMVDLPTSHTRRGFGPNPSLLSLTDRGISRYSGGREMSVPLPSLEDVSTATGNWLSSHGIPSVDETDQPSRPAISAAQGLVIDILPTGILQLDEREVAPDSLAAAIQEALAENPRPIFVEPQPTSEFEHLVFVFDRLYEVAESGTPVRFALPDGRLSQRDEAVGIVRRLRPAKTEAPPMLLKIDKNATFRDVQKVLDLVSRHLDRLTLLTQLDLSEPSRITASTWPGGLPGGMTLALAKPTVLQLAQAEERGTGSKRRRTGILMPPPSPAQVGGQRADGRKHANTVAQAKFLPVDTPEIYHTGGDVTAPVKISGPDPELSEVANKARVQGLVILQAVILADGTVGSVKALKGLPFDLTERAIEAVEQWTFEPATRLGQPVPVYHNLTVTFRPDPA